MPFAESVSPIVFAVWGGIGFFAGSGRSRLPPFAGAIPLGWYGGCAVLSAKPSGEIGPSKTCTGPCMIEAGDPGLFLSLPLASSCARIDAGAVGNADAHAQISH